MHSCIHTYIHSKNTLISGYLRGTFHTLLLSWDAAPGFAELVADFRVLAASSLQLQSCNLNRALLNPRVSFKAPGFRFLQGLLDLPLVSREWKNGSNSSYNCTPFLHSLLTKGK